MLLLSNGLKQSGAMRGASEKKALSNDWKKNRFRFELTTKSDNCEP